MDVSPARLWREKEFAYKLSVLKCEKCGWTYVGNLEKCPKCGSPLRRVQMPKKGKVISWTKLVQVPEELEDFAPIYLALIELEDGSTVVSRLVDVIGEPTDGMEVEAVLRRLRVDGVSGLIEYGLVFRPVLNR
ncbi:DNA-binding protein [Ignicoccus islandicus DSM 13165]|uniref:DNA-binding protein n=1 Tax=Ignicoccus islandicus DSM 13165 TaxID=940295 RepID=A0A0U3E0M8_9CREN|nr:Zn-ribbon domain-containing OB-fold protein [Ignicoccus islandicus]ALU11467.1 DNA-binding protein [Ignicoccus islandicus DSM 13165]